MKNKILKGMAMVMMTILSLLGCVAICQSELDPLIIYGAALIIGTYLGDKIAEILDIKCKK